MRERGWGGDQGWYWNHGPKFCQNCCIQSSKSDRGQRLREVNVTTHMTCAILKRCQCENV